MKRGWARSICISPPLKICSSVKSGRLVGAEAASFSCPGNSPFLAVNTLRQMCNSARQPSVQFPASTIAVRRTCRKSCPSQKARAWLLGCIVRSFSQRLLSLSLWLLVGSDWCPRASLDVDHTSFAVALIWNLWKAVNGVGN